MYYFYLAEALICRKFVYLYNAIRHIHADEIKIMRSANHKMKEANKKNIGIDLFAGAGGLSLGAEMAGISMRYAVESDTHAAASYRKNFKEATVFCEDIRKLSTDGLKSEPVFIIMGGPPCQGFSLSNTKTRDMSNPNNRMFEEFVRFVHDIGPTWFVFENVYGLTKFKNGDENIQDHIEKRFRAIGYEVNSKILYASDYGVPQRRNRLFIVGNRNGIKFEFPDKFDYSVSVDEAIGDLPVLCNGETLMEGKYTIPFEQATPYAQLMREKSKAPTQNIVSRNRDYVIERYKYIGEGENWSSIPDRLMGNYADKKRSHSGIYKRLIGSKPSVVISNYRKSMLIHPHQDRGLSVREAARLQSFPDHFIFEGPVSYVQQQIGNAVPPLLAKAVMEKILSYE